MSLTLDDIRGRLTLTVPEAGALCSLGRDAAYAAAERGELPARRVGRRLLVPTHALLIEVLGMTPDLARDVLGLPETLASATNDGPTTAVTPLHPRSDPANARPGPGTAA